MKVYFVIIAVVLAVLTGFVQSRAAKISSFVEQYQKLCQTVTVNNCTVEYLEVGIISEKSLIDKLENPSFDQRHTALINQYYHYFVSMMFKKRPHGNATQVAAFSGNILDRVFAQRPWWLIRKYPYEPHESESEQSVMILERVPALIEVSSRAIIAANSPPLEGCKTRYKNVKIGLGSWGNDLVANFPAFFDHYPEFIKMIYATTAGSPRDHVGFVEPQSCPNNVDKYTCVFLPISNCSLPEGLATCKKEDCMKEGIFSPTTGQRLEKDPDDAKFSHKETFYPEPFELSRRYNHEFIRYQSLHLKDSIGPVVNSNVEFVERSDLWGQLHQSNYVFNLLNRFNYRMGLKVQDFVNREIFGTKSGILVNLNVSRNKPKEILAASLDYPSLGGVVTDNDVTFCVATHIRMGDRHVENISMLHWCQEHTRAGATGDDRAFGTWFKDGTNLTMGQWHDMGCSARLPFGALSLIKIINASRLVSPHAKEILIMTDDHRWLRKELTVLGNLLMQTNSPDNKQWPILRIVPTHMTNVHHDRMSWPATVEWWAAIMAARRCGAFVGHLHSAATTAIYRAMCFEHEGRYMRCPKLFQFD